MLAATTEKGKIPSSNSKMGIPGFKRGQILRLSDAHKENWCNDCWVTIMVDVKQEGLYDIVAKTDRGIQTL
jgi:hypothetical protein